MDAWGAEEVGLVEAGEDFRVVVPGDMEGLEVEEGLVVAGCGEFTG